MNFPLLQYLPLQNPYNIIKIVAGTPLIGLNALLCKDYGTLNLPKHRIFSQLNIGLGVLGYTDYRIFGLFVLTTGTNYLLIKSILKYHPTSLAKAIEQDDLSTIDEIFKKWGDDRALMYPGNGKSWSEDDLRKKLDQEGIHPTLQHFATHHPESIFHSCRRLLFTALLKENIESANLIFSTNETYCKNTNNENLLITKDLFDIELCFVYELFDCPTGLQFFLEKNPYTIYFRVFDKQVVNQVFILNVNSLTETLVSCIEKNIQVEDIEDLFLYLTEITPIEFYKKIFGLGFDPAFTDSHQYGSHTILHKLVHRLTIYQNLDNNKTLPELIINVKNIINTFESCYEGKHQFEELLNKKASNGYTCTKIIYETLENLNTPEDEKKAYLDLYSFLIDKGADPVKTDRMIKGATLEEAQDRQIHR